MINDDSPKRPIVTPHAKGTRGVTSVALAILVPYSMLMTVVALVYYTKYETARSKHPLEEIPDLLGEFRNLQKKGGAKQSSQSLRLPPPDKLELPPHLVTTLGVPITVGAIEVTPIRIERRVPVAFSLEKGKDEPEKIVGANDHLVLHLRLRNVSPDLIFYPSDPYFTRRPKDASDRPYSLVEVEGRKFYGGLIAYSTEHGRVEREWVGGQENDHLPLAPGESRETVVVTHPRDGVIAAVNASKVPALWRIHVRRGMVRFRDTEIPASCVIGVAFSAKDVVAEA